MFSPGLNAALARSAKAEQIEKAQKVERSIKRTPWKVDVHDRLIRVREDLEMAVRSAGLQIDQAPDCWSADEEGSAEGTYAQIGLTLLPGSTDVSKLSEAQSVVRATFVYIEATIRTLRQSTQTWQRPWEWLTGGLLMSAYTTLASRWRRTRIRWC